MPNEMAIALQTIAESLSHKSRARIVNPLILSLHRLAGQRFRKQSAHFRKTGLPLILDSTAAGTLTAGKVATALRTLDQFRYRPFEDGYAKLVSAAWQGGAEIARADLGADDTVADIPAGGPGRTAADLEAELDATTEARVESAIKKGMEEGYSRAEMNDAVQGLWKDWADASTTSRAAGIAVNEVARAFNQGMRAAARAMPGTILKEWWTEEGACDLCEENTGESIELDEPFASGDLEPPGHLWCRCSLRLSKREA